MQQPREEITASGGTVAGAPLVDAHKRERCWVARDAYHACLDAGKANGSATGEEACAEPLRIYAAECPRSWLIHFEKRRKAEHERRLREEAYQRRSG